MFSVSSVSFLPVSALTWVTDLTKCAVWCTPPATMVATPSACSSGTMRYWPKPTSSSKSLVQVEASVLVRSTGVFLPSWKMCLRPASLAAWITLA